MILFNSKIGPRGLSNMHPARFVLDGEAWGSSEHYYQAHKTEDQALAERIRLCRTSWDAKRIGKTVRLRPGWDKLKVEVMRRALEAKFSQNIGLARVLLATGSEELAEYSPWDKYWGTSGVNMMGKLLMEIRATLQAKAA